MTIEQKRKCLEKIVKLQKDIEALKQAREEVALTGFASATLSSQGGTRSYTRLSLDAMSKLISELQQELTGYRTILAGGSYTSPKQIYQIYY